MVFFKRFFFFILIVSSQKAFALSEPVLGEPPVDENRERQRLASAAIVQKPKIQQIYVNGELRWMFEPSLDHSSLKNNVVNVRVNDKVIVKGSGFGAGPTIDYSRVLVGNVRILERNLEMYDGFLDVIKKNFYQRPTVFDRWNSDILAWSDDAIEFRVPETASSGALHVSVQKRIGANKSLSKISGPHTIWDSLTERITRDKFDHLYDVISVLGEQMQSNGVFLDVDNPDFMKRFYYGEAVFWAYDYNIGMVHHMIGLDWTKILKGEMVDPITGLKADPVKLFGAVPLKRDQVPAVAAQPYYFKRYPQPMPLKPIFAGDSLKSGTTSPSGHVGYVYAEQKNPITAEVEKHIGFNCASCHGQLITYEAAPGKTVSKVFPGLPNHEWSMKWSTLGHMHGVTGKEPNALGVKRKVDKTTLLYAVPGGAGEHTLVRPKNDGSFYGNDQLFSPIAIPPITRHTPVRRALSRSEMVAGFEGSYIHAEEPDGALGAMHSDDLKSLTVYMSRLDSNNSLLRKLGLYRWLKDTGRLDEVAHVGEGAFVQSSMDVFPKLKERLERGAAAYDASCMSCHTNNYGTYTDENMIPLSQVGTYFSPTVYHKQMQSIRTAILGNMYWVQKRGLLHDTHVKTLEDLIHPDRGDVNSELHKRYYTLHPGTFKVLKGNKEQEQAVRDTHYFVDVPWDQKHLYWDYQKMRREFGPKELGSLGVVDLPQVPHPWFVKKDEVDDVTAFVLTL